MIRRLGFIMLLTGTLLGPLCYQFRPAPQVATDSIALAAIGLGLLTLDLIGRLIESA